MTTETPTTEQINTAEAAMVARRISIARDSIGSPLFESIVADAIGGGLAGNHEFGEMTKWLNKIADTLILVGREVEDMYDRIVDADVCYRDHTLSNGGFDKLPRWARDAIVENKDQA